MNRFEWERAVRAERGGLSSTEKLVALTLATYADGAGEGARPGERRLAADTGLSDRTVRRALDVLRAGGWVERVVEGARQGRRAVVDEYRLTREPIQPALWTTPDHRTPMTGDRGVEHRNLTTGSPDTDDRITGHGCPATGTGPEQEQTTVVPLVRNGPGGRPVDNPRRRSTGRVASTERGPPHLTFVPRPSMSPKPTHLARETR